MKIVEFKCKRCERVQEQLIENKDNLPEDSCIECQAMPDQLEIHFASNKIGRVHGSASNWRIMG